jgi:hypothetical protein
MLKMNAMGDGKFPLRFGYASVKQMSVLFTVELREHGAVLICMRLFSTF